MRTWSAGAIVRWRFVLNSNPYGGHVSKSPLEKLIPTMTANLVSEYHNASASARALGARWYPEARAIVQEWASSYNVTADTVACVIAAISPQCEWERNLIIADDVLAERAQSIGGALHVNVAKARRLRDVAGAVSNASGRTIAERMALMFPSGPKVYCFAQNLAGDDSLVTVDTHATQAALNDVTTRITLNWTRYRIVAEAYARAAARVGESPARFQAIIWHAWKERYPRTDKVQLRRKR